MKRKITLFLFLLLIPGFLFMGQNQTLPVQSHIFSTNCIPVKELTFYPGETFKVWDTRNIPAGVYFYRSLQKDGTAEYGKVVVE